MYDKSNNKNDTSSITSSVEDETINPYQDFEEMRHAHLSQTNHKSATTEWQSEEHIFLDG